MLTNPVSVCPIPLQNIICPICELRYERAENFKNHMYIHANQKFGCPQCDKLFTRPKTLSDHMRDVHLQYCRKDAPKPELTVLAAKAAKAAQTVRTVEGEPQEGNSIGDGQGDGEEGGGGDQSAVGYDYGDIFVASLKRGVVSCPVCQIPCHSHKTFEDHVRSHIDRKARACPICLKQFLRMDNLKCHMYSHTDATFKCPHCPKTFINPKTLGTHMRDAHLKELTDKTTADDAKPRKTDHQSCSYCGKFFGQMRQLSEHLKLHTSDARHPCTTCNMTFRLKISLNMHVAKVHGMGARGTAVNCCVCDEVLSSRAQLNTHMLRQHADEQHLCLECGELCKTARSLVQHQEARHNDEKNHVCKECGRSFDRASKLKDHMLVVHAAERPMTCEMCGQQFKCTRNLMAHIKSMHKVQ